jgi:hypothetical protein
MSWETEKSYLTFCKQKTINQQQQQNQKKLGNRKKLFDILQTENHKPTAAAAANKKKPPDHNELSIFLIFLEFYFKQRRTLFHIKIILF